LFRKCLGFIVKSSQLVFRTGLGALLVRNQSAYVLDKRYFGGGTVNIAIPSKTFHVKREKLHERYKKKSKIAISILRKFMQKKNQLIFIPKIRRRDNPLPLHPGHSTWARYFEKTLWIHGQNNDQDIPSCSVITFPLAVSLIKLKYSNKFWL